ADGEGGKRGLAVLIANAEAQLARREGIEEHHDVVAEPDVLCPLADVEADLGGALAAVAAVDFENPVFETKSRKPLGKRVFVIERNIRPPLLGLRRREFHRRLGAAVRTNVDRTAVGALDHEARSDPGLVANLAQKDSRPRPD